MFEYRSKVLAILNQKGGVGKSTTVQTLAEYGALLYKMKKNQPVRILVCDMDMQCNTSDYFVGMEPSPRSVGGQLPPVHPDVSLEEGLFEERSTIADIFYGKMVLPHTVRVGSEDQSATIDVAIGHPSRLEEINTEYTTASGEIDTMVINRLGEVLHSEGAADSYDLIILDTGPSRSPTFRAALRAATHVLVPFEPEEKSLQGVNSMVQAINSENFNRPNNCPKVKMIGLLPNRYRAGSPLHVRYLKEIRDGLPQISMPSDLYFPTAQAFPERDVKGANPKSLFDLKKSNKVRARVEKVCAYVFRAIFAAEKVQSKNKCA